MIKTPDWQHGRITCTWYLNCNNGHKMGIIRFHRGKVPGYYNAVVTVFIEDGEYELLGFKVDPGCNPSKTEYEIVFEYLDQFGKRRKSDRAK